MGIYELKQGIDMVYENMNSVDNSGEVYNSYKNVADQPNIQSHHEPIVYEELPTSKVSSTYFSISVTQYEHSIPSVGKPCVLV